MTTSFEASVWKVTNEIRVRVRVLLRVRLFAGASLRHCSGRLFRVHTYVELVDAIVSRAPTETRGPTSGIRHLCWNSNRGPCVVIAEHRTAGSPESWIDGCTAYSYLLESRAVYVDHELSSACE
jgi:hypothetical protein